MVKIFAVILMKSLWKATAKMPEFPKLERDIACDVLIIGGGIAGVLTAFFLKQNGVNYILVEQGKICDGTTANTTAKITSQHGLIYNDILQSKGFEVAKLYLTANETALQSFKELAQKIECDFEGKDNYVYSLNNRKKLEDEVLALQKIGYNAELVNTNNLPIKTVGAVRFKNQAQFHPLKFLSEISKSLNIFENTKIIEVKENHASTNNAKIRFKKAIITTHFPFIDKHGSYFFKLYQHRSYVTALESAEDLDGMYVDEAKEGLSFRNYKNLLLLGGGGHRTGKDNGNFEKIKKAVKEFYPHAIEKYFWAAQDCMSLDSVPYIGKYYENTPNLYTATGFNKWGMTGSMVAAKILCDKIIGKDSDFAHIFSPSRSIIKPQLFINSFETFTNFLKPTTRRCSHLGCALKFNKYEHSWDCACHGSRFDRNGEVINNPANRDL